MCGILGWAADAAPSRLEAFENSLDTLTHRGPDDRGVYKGEGVLLGHRRLSIIDLSPGGHQPMQDPGSQQVIVYNGEIFNYPELRSQLEGTGHSFRTASDTEVLLHAYLEWGPAALNKLNGMWGFAVWHPVERKLFVARDRFGIKPFYYSAGSGSFAFASEPKALLKLFPELRIPDDRAVYDFLAQGLLYAADRSFYKNIRILPPGCYGEYSADTGRFHITRYWDYPASGPHGAESDNRSTAPEEFFELFEDSVRLRMRSDVPVGVTLSGGLDSTAVLAASVRQSTGRRVCFTSVYGGCERGEADWATVAAEPYKLTPVEVAAPRSEWLDSLQSIAYHMDGPGYSPAVYPLWRLMKRARQEGVPVLLEGQGADEELGGYPQYAILSFLDLLRQPSRSGLRKTVSSWKKLSSTFTTRWALLWLIRELFPGLVALNRRRGGAFMTLNADFKLSAENMRNESGSIDPTFCEPDYAPVGKRLWQDHARNILPGLLHYGDAISMAHGVESRLPFMDYRLVEWIFSQPDHIKIREGQTKWVLREYLRNVSQRRIAERKDKQGYPTPAEKWLAENNGALVRDMLLVPDAMIKRFCDNRGIERLLKKHLAGRPGAGNHIYRLFSMELWMRSCL